MTRPERPPLPGPALLFCPADRPDRYAKALGAADAAILDLEDGVGADGKDATVLKLKAEGDARLFCVGPELFAATATLIASPTPLKTVHDVKHHIALLRSHGIDLQGVDFDTMLAGFLINPGKTEPTLGDLYHQHIAPLASGEPTGSEPALAGPTTMRLSPSTLAIEPPPAPISTISITGMRNGRPLPLAKR